MRLFLAFAVAQTVASALNKAMNDGKVTVGEILEIAKETVESAGVADFQVYPLKKDKEGKNEYNK